MQRVKLLVLTLLICISASAQVLKGKIMSTGGEPIPFATIYIHEITSGFVANEQGEFQTRLIKGTYTCEIRCIGYQSQTMLVEVSPQGAELKILLAEKPIWLKELTVKPSKDNPADRIMRHSIARAPFHLYQLSGYTSENYIKGSAKIEKIPGLMKMMIKDNKIKSLIGKLLVMESKNVVTFKSPFIYTQRVIAYKSSIPKEMEPKGGFSISPSSIYQPIFREKISPLSTHAFQYYKFKLEDVFTNGNYQVNKIHVFPKLKNEKLFSGYIYIIEDNWSVFSLDITSTEMGTTTHSKINYQEVRPSVFMPITYDTYTGIGTMGVKGYARFYSSVKYTNINENKPDQAVQIGKIVSDSKPVISKRNKKIQDKINELSAKDKISTGEAIRLAGLMNSIIEPKEIKKRKDSLEIKENKLVQMEIDSLASKRDSAYWEDIRVVPLLAEEVQSFMQKDSLPVSKSISTDANSISFSVGNSTNVSSWLFGGNILVGKSARLSYSGLLGGMLKEYNFADGFWLGQKLTLSIPLSKTNSLVFSPSAYYTTARKSVIWNIDTYYNYAPLSGGRLKLSAGNTSSDIQGEKGIPRFINSISSLFLGDNAIRFFQKKYINLENQIDIANGFRLITGVGYEYRKLLNNYTGYHIAGQTPLPNYPDQAYRDAFPNHTATTGWMKLEYTPYNKYRIKEGKKENAGSGYPTFNLEYSKAIPLFNQSEHSSFDKIEISIHQNITLTAFDKLSYSVSTGTFLTKQSLFAPDYQYFITSPLFISSRSFDNNFNLMENYTFNNNKWLESNLTWTSDYLALKRIGFMQSFLFNESLQVHSLWSMQNEKPYIEAGYSIGFSWLGRIGIFTSFNGFTYKNRGIKVSIPMFSGIGKK